MDAPKIDSRSYDDIVSQVAALAASYSGWQPGDEADAGDALIRIFSHYAELIIERLNQVPDNSFLAFLNLIGAGLTMPLPARVPLTFSLATSSTVDGYVPAGTQVSAAATADEAEAFFETEADLVVTAAQLSEVFVRSFTDEEDRYGHYTDQATGLVDETFPLFVGDTKMEHFLYIASGALINLAEATDVTIQLHTTAISEFAGYQADADKLASYPLSCAYWDADSGTWTEIEGVTIQAIDEDPHDYLSKSLCQIVVPACPPLVESVVNGITGGWLRLQLNLPLPSGRADFSLEAMQVGSSGAMKDFDLPVLPFGEEGTANYFYLGVASDFLHPGSTMVLDVTLDANIIIMPDPSATLDLMYQTDGGWQWFSDIKDGTAGFTQDGLVKFEIPVGFEWPVTLFNNRSGRWLRFSSGGEGQIQQAPVIASMSIYQEWNLPSVNTVDILLPAERSSLLVEGAQYNSSTLDVTNYFYPFGEEPSLYDCFYLAYGNLITEGHLEAGELVQIEVALAQAGLPGAVTLSWEFWNGRQWRPLGQSSQSETSITLENGVDYGFQDGTKAFTFDEADEEIGPIQFTLPATAVSNTVNGTEDYWLRVRIIVGGYGQAATYTATTVNGIPSYTLAAATYQPPIIATATFDVSGKTLFPLSACLSYNDFVYVDQTEANLAGTGFLPFTPTTDDNPTLYLGFDRPFANQAVALYCQTALPALADILPDVFQSELLDESTHLTWEYGGTGGWSPLVVSDETNTFAQRGLLQFVGPADFTSRELFGESLYWLRVRWTDGDFAVLPTSHRLRLNTMWASQRQSFTNEILGSSDGSVDQTFQTLHYPVSSGQQLEVKEPHLTEDELETLQMQGTVTLILNDVGYTEEAWVVWQEVTDFYASTATDRHYILDHLTGEIQFGNGIQGAIPPAALNNIRLATYSIGGGESGNRDAETITQLKKTIPYVKSVTNNEAASGGADLASLTRVKTYGPRLLRHRGRAVTSDDIADLVYQTFTDVAFVRVISPTPALDALDLWLEPNTTPDTTEHELVTAAGEFGIIIVPDGEEAQPIPSVGLLAAVRAYLLQTAELTANVWISGPEWMAVSVSAVVVPTSLAAAHSVAENVTAALDSFLHPLTGGFDGTGWTASQRPYDSDFYTLLESVAGVDYVQSLTVTENPAADALTAGHYLIYSGDHTITVTVSG